jgi:signal recognition particle receptor subunit beta
MVTEQEILKLYGTPGQPKIKFTMPMLEEMTKNKEMLG